jgi:hypothetical protein
MSTISTIIKAKNKGVAHNTNLPEPSGCGFFTKKLWFSIV